MVSLLVLVGGILVVIWLAVVAAIVWVVVSVGIVVVGPSSCCGGGILLLLSLLLSLSVALLLVSRWSGWFVSTTSAGSGGILLLRRLVERRISGWLLFSPQLKVSSRATAWARMVSVVSAPLNVILPVSLVSASCSEVRSEPTCLAASEVSTAWCVHDWMVMGVRPKGGSRLLFLLSHQLIEGLV